ncbi:alcohol dehydrogenase catalytic domain-containing protein [Streptomyces sp. NPDC093108]|uniref:alcohol dehydrogenase catalytic domain-containing protein n=1 Tax=Streptomyces sp. NPDC093108 TaxID=3366030 RepID=UPI00382F0970
MRAIRQEEFGGPEVLREVTVPRPVPDVGEVRIAVRAAGVNPTDCRHRAGGLFLRRLPLTLGWDVSGVVESVGLGVTLFRPGDEVFGMLPYPYGVGSHAQYVVGPARSFARKPAGLGHVQAAAADEAEREAGQGGRVRTIAVQADHAGIKAIADLAASGALRPHIEATFPLAKATEAHTLLENGQTAGKIVLVVEHRNTD